MIQLFKPYVCQAAKDNVARVLDSGWLGMGPECEAFEKEFADYIGCKHAISLNSATEALRIALHAGQPYSRATVLTTPNTFVATNHVILQEGLIPYFMDIDANTGMVNPRSLAAYIEVHHFTIAAVMYVYYGGTPVDLSRVKELCTHYGINLIEDAAHAAGATWNGERIGKDADMACFSFHAVKNLATGDGGMMVTNDRLMANRARKLRWFGINKSTADRSKEKQYGWEYDVESLGYKSHMNDITAALGRGQLTKLDEQNAIRERLYQRYRTRLAETQIRLLARDPRGQSSNHLMVVRFPNGKAKKKAIERLTKEEITYGYHYKPNYLYPPYAPFVKGMGFIGMDDFYSTALSLPMHIFLRDCDVDKICEVMLEDN